MIAAAAERNKRPILEILKKYIKNTDKVLEISSGTGQHCVYFAEQLSSTTWQPSDCDDQYLTSIRQNVTKSNLRNVLLPVTIDVTCPVDTWPHEAVKNIDFIYNSNMIHITPIDCTYGLFTAAGQILPPGGHLVTYGPYAVDGVLTPESNVSFDQSLKSRNPSWGIKDVTLLKEIASKHDLKLQDTHEMPANNKCLVFVKSNEKV